MPKSKAYWKFLVQYLFLFEHPAWRFANVDFINCIVGENLRKRKKRMMRKMLIISMVMCMMKMRTMVIKRTIVMLTMLLLMMAVVTMITLVVAAAVAACFLVGKDAKILSKDTWVEVGRK